MLPQSRARTQPDEKRPGMFVDEVLDSIRCVQIDFLQHIVRIDSAVKSLVESEIDDMPQAFSVTGKQLGQCLFVADS